MEYRMKIKDFFKKLIRIISRTENIGGLVLGDSSFNYAKIVNGAIRKSSLRLIPGMVEAGRVKDRKAVVVALSQLKKQISPRKEKINAIVSLENTLVYSQVFSLPQLEKRLLAEAANLNMQMISPIDIKQAYYGYQLLGPVASGSNQTELLAAFIPANIVDEWISVLGEAGFSVAAVEYRALSLVRALNVFKKFDEKKVYVVLVLSNEGMDLTLVKNAGLYFDYFSSWRAIQGDKRDIPFDLVEKTIVAEMGKVINFSSFRFGGRIDRIYLLAPGLTEEIRNFLAKRFPETGIEELFSPEEKIYPAGVESFGTALRGEISRSRDENITLGPISVAEEYFYNQTLSFIGFWRNAVAAALAFFIVISLGGRIFLSGLTGSIQAVPQISAANAEELNTLEKQVREFNRAVSIISESRGQENKISPIINLVENSAESSIVRISRFSFQDDSRIFSVNGSASSPKEIFDFKRLLENNPSISDILLPLPSNSSGPENRSIFNLSFKVKE